jgi:hypothetical protein
MLGLGVADDENTSGAGHQPEGIGDDLTMQVETGPFRHDDINRNDGDIRKNLGRRS